MATNVTISRKARYAWLTLLLAALCASVGMGAPRAWADEPTTPTVGEPAALEAGLAEEWVPATAANASDTVQVSITGRYDQTEARKLLAMVNEARAKVGQPALGWNASLEQTAMQRAAEISVYYEHERPDARTCFTAFPTGYTWAGENIAMGYTDAEWVNTGWTNSEGHYANMIHSSFTSLGTACFIDNDGYYHWVECFSNLPGGSISGAPADGTAVMQVPLAADHAELYLLNERGRTISGGSELRLTYGQDHQLTPRLGNGGFFANSSDVAYALSNSAIAQVKDGKVTATKVGQTTLTASLANLPSVSTGITVVVDPANIGTATVTAPNQTYAGRALTPAPTVRLDGKTLQADTDYTVSYSNNTNAGTATVTVTGTGNYTGTASATFTISPAALTSATAASQTYDGSAKRPTPTVRAGSLTVPATGYTVGYTNNVNAGTATVTVTGTGNYTGTVSSSFTIERARIARPAARTGLAYTGSSQTGVAAAAGYTVTGGSATNAGSYTATARLDSNHAWADGSTSDARVAWSIAPASIAGATVSASNQTYTSRAHTPAPTVRLGSKALQSGTEYNVSYANNVNAGTATVTVTGTGNYTGTASTTFRINPASITSASVAPTSATFTGSAISRPTATVKAGQLTVPASGYNASWSTSDFTNAGTKTLTVTGKGNYTGSATATFAIERARVVKPSARTGLAYTGSSQTGVAAAAGYTVTGGSATNAGSYTATARLDSNHAWADGSTADARVAWSIAPASIASATIDAIPAQGYDGSAKTPAPVVRFGGRTLQVGTDYTVSYSNNVNAGTATVTVTGTGNYTGTVSSSFTIERARIARPAARTGLAYTGSSQTGVAAAAGYTVTGGSATNAGSYTATARLDSNHAWADGSTSDARVAWSIAPASIASATIDAIPAQGYDGSAKTPAPMVRFGGRTLSPGADYTVSYATNTAVGTATATVTGTGNFQGSATVNFAIVEVKVAWKRLAGQNAYGTMQKVVAEGWAKADTVVVATFNGYWDALSASGLAGKHHAPILLTGKDSLASATKTEIRRLGARNAIIVGGQAAVSKAVERELASMGLAVSRHAGGNAQQTAVDINMQLAAGSDVCIVATSGGYWDALSASPYAYAKRAPIYLTDAKGVLSAQTLAAMRAGGFKRAVIAGGPSAVSSRTEGDLAAIGIADVSRKAGHTAIETSLAFAEFAIGEGMAAQKMGVATSGGYWDALTGGALCGANNAVLVLASAANTSNAKLPAAHRAEMTTGYVFGGTSALPATVFDAFDRSTRPTVTANARM